VTDDADHAAAKMWFDGNTERLFVTDLIIDETLTLLRTRGEHRKGMELGKMFFETNDVSVHFLSEDELRQSWLVFKQFADKDWSFTDCSSKFICEKFNIDRAVSFDRLFTSSARSPFFLTDVTDCTDR
jgi:predicted nucleic acid-binding protein